ncbi:MAG: hypothetical protein ACLRJV_16155 [Eubacteriales bacterium]
MSYAGRRCPRCLRGHGHAGKIIAAGDHGSEFGHPAIICRTVREAGYGSSDYEVEVITHEQSRHCGSCAAARRPAQEIGK